MAVTKLLKDNKKEGIKITVGWTEQLDPLGEEQYSMSSLDPANPSLHSALQSLFNVAATCLNWNPEYDLPLIVLDMVGRKLTSSRPAFLARSPAAFENIT